MRAARSVLLMLTIARIPVLAQEVERPEFAPGAGPVS